MKKLKITITISIFATLAVFFGIMSYGNEQGTPMSKSKIKSAAGVIADTCKNLIVHKYYVVNLNPVMRVPNYVIWHLGPNKCAKLVPRKDHFVTDTLNSFTLRFSATPKDYTNSGYDRGHLMNADDSRFDPIAELECFNMTNMAPQIHYFNAGTWVNLERYERVMAISNEIDIIAGVFGFDGRTIGYNKVGVPNTWWKVIVDMKNQKEIAFIFYEKDNFKTHVISVKDLEKLIHFNITPTFPDAVEQDIDYVYWKLNPKNY